jgi:hypothetical protein
VEENESIKRLKGMSIVLALLPIPAVIVGAIFFHPTLIRLGADKLEEPDWLAPSVIIRAVVLLAVVIGCGLLMLKELRATRVRRPKPVTAGLKLTQLPVPAACPFCKADLARADLGSGVIRCGDCEVAHHSECWTSHGGCSTHGCARGPREPAERVEA